MILTMPLGTFMKHMEPLNIIKNYYGEKYALFVAFLCHHIAMLVYLTPVALSLQAYIMI